VPTIWTSSALAPRLKQREIGVPPTRTAAGAAPSAFAIAPGPPVQAAGSFSLPPPQPASARTAAPIAAAQRTRGSKPPPGSARWRAYDRLVPPLSVADPLAHRALEALVRAEAQVRRSVAAELQRAGLSTGAFSVLVVLTTAGGELELRTLRRRLGWSKANATEVTAALERQGLVTRRRLASDRRTLSIGLTATGAELVQAIFPTHADRVSQAFAALDENEKRSLASICRKLAA
jgi:MarR family transcriptional regulator, 2-MHQ and catechol-resistance regulon repressor